MKRLLLALFLLVPLCGFAQQKITPITLGISHSRGWALYGKPTSFFLGGVHYRSLPRLGNGLLWEVYARRTGTHIYEARLLYQTDPDSSRLHPTTKIEEVRFAFDKPLSAREALRAIPEVVKICAAGCDVLSYRDNTSEHLKVQPRQMSNGHSVFELSWSAADGVTERPVHSPDDSVTGVEMYDRAISDQADSTYATATVIGKWPESENHATR